jgi:hypothetical protein
MGKSLDDGQESDDKVEVSLCPAAAVPWQADEAISPVGEKAGAQSVDTLARDFLSALNSLSVGLDATGTTDSSSGAASGSDGIDGEVSSGLLLEPVGAPKDAEDFVAKVDAELARTLGELEMEEQNSGAGSQPGQSKGKQEASNTATKTRQTPELFQTLISFSSPQERKRRRRRAIVGIAAAILVGILVLLLSGVFPKGRHRQERPGGAPRATAQSRTGTPAQDEDLAEVSMPGASGSTKESGESLEVGSWF